MPLANQQPVRFTPKGLTDAFDATEAFPGACRALTNLVFDQSNPELIQCRPGVVKLTSFAGFNTPTFVSCQISIGTMIYGMVSTAANAGQDEPFAYDASSNTFLAITNVLAGNTPTSPSTTGAWNPPAMSVVGTKILVTHPGFPGTGTNYFGVIDITVPATPAWSSHNLATHGLPSAPTWVANLYNRAYFACGNALYFSDVLDPLTATNAGQSLTCGDPSVIRAVTGLPVSTTSSGVVQALLAFKDFQIWQVTGDAALSTLSLNFLSLNVGTSAPRSVVQTPYGTNFMAIDGPYIVDPVGLVKPMTKEPRVTEQDIQSPFIYATQPSRVAAGYSGGVYRICMQTVLDGATNTNDYWFDIQRRRWNGPHTFAYDSISQVGNYFVLSSAAKGAALFKSQIVQDIGSVYADDGVAISFNMVSSAFPKDMTMTEKMVIESTIELSSSGAAVAYGITALDDTNTTMSTVALNITSAAYLWNGTTWGGGMWSSSTNIPTVYNVPWTEPLVFQKMALQVNGTAQSNVSIGTFFARYQLSGYTNRR